MAYHNYRVTGRAESIDVAAELAFVHNRLGLYGATKYYALAGAVQALSLSHLDSRAEGIPALALAGLADAAHGATVNVMLLTHLLLEARADYKGGMTGNEEDKLRDLLIASLYMAQIASKPMFERFREAIYPLPHGEKQAQEAFGLFGLSRMSLDEVRGRLKDLGCPAPLSDMAYERRIAWAQAGVQWAVTWEQSYTNTCGAESLVASLQCLLSSRGEDELCLFPVTVGILVDANATAYSVRRGKARCEVALKVELPWSNGITGDAAAETLDSAIRIVQFVSALQSQELESIFKDQGGRALDGAIPADSYPRLFTHVYERAQFNNLIASSPDHLKDCVLPPQTQGEVASNIGVHPRYDAEKSLGNIRRRYQWLSGQLRYMLPVLREDPSFMALVKSLQQRGWKDWHILLAVNNIRMNYIVKRLVPDDATDEQAQRVADSIRTRDETESDPRPRLTDLNETCLKEALERSQFATLTFMGFDCRCGGPGFVGIDRFLLRFRYWDDDVSHDPFF
ncbi:MAG: hypothetical protein ACLQBK_23540 [Candidatus Sulfotelmatobacter sp.]